MGEEGGANLYACLRNGCLIFNDLLGLSPYVLGSKIPKYGVTMRENTWNSVRAKTAWSVVYRECVFFCAFLNMVGGFALFYDDAAGNIHHYLKGGGDTKVIDFERMNFESIEAKRHYRSEVNDALRYAEKLVLSDNVPTTISTPKEASWAVNSGDWFYAVHNYRTWARGTVTKCGNNYKMDWHFFFRDVYDWDANDGVGGVFVSNYDMMMLHRYGLGREFRMTGRQDMHIEWQKGDRFSASMLHLKKATQPVDALPVENGIRPTNIIFMR